MTHTRIARCCGVAFLGAVSMTMAQNAGQVNFLEYTGSTFTAYTDSPDAAVQQWLRTHFAGIISYSPYFDSRTGWFPNAYFYQDLYSVYPGSSIQYTHPEWILHDQYGKALYIPWGCGGGTCPQYAADITNPAFRSWWISQAAARMKAGNYRGIFVDDVNMEFRISDGSGNPVLPVDSNTGQLMSYDAWRAYVARFTEQIRAAFPSARIIHNSIWYAGPAGVRDFDPSIQREIAAADVVNLERGVASDASLTGGTGQFSLYALLNFIDRVHAAGKSVNFLQDALDVAGQQYGLAAYFLTSSGSDSIGDTVTTPHNWWPGYSVDLGRDLGPRAYLNGVFRRNFVNGVVLVGEPGLAPQSVDLAGAYTTLDGVPVTSVTLSGRQGIILLANPSQRNMEPSGIVNAASLAAGPISPGEVVTLFSSNSSASPVVRFNGVPAPITYSGANQVNVIVPFGLDLSHPAEVELQQDASSAKTSVPVAAASPALFTANSTGAGPGAILNPDYSLNSPGNPADRGSIIAIYATGFGPLSAAPADGQIMEALANTASAVTATIAGVPAEVVYAGAAPGLVAGVFQINVRIPEAAGVNPAAPIVLSIGSFTTQAGVTVALR